MRFVPEDKLKAFAENYRGSAHTADNMAQALLTFVKGTALEMPVPGDAAPVDAKPQEPETFTEIVLVRLGYSFTRHRPDYWALTVLKGGHELAHYWPLSTQWHLVESMHDGRGLEAMVDALGKVGK